MRLSLLAVGMAVFSIAAAAEPTARGRLSETTSANALRPNVIVIVADDLGYADVSSYGVDRIPTPNIDRIADEGVLFTDAYVTAPVCGPSRAALQTGRHQDRFGFEFNNGPAGRDARENLGLPASEITIADALQHQGYHTGIIGKWHLGSNDDFYPTNRGYKEFVGLLSGATAYIDRDVPGVRRIAIPGERSYDGMVRKPLNKIYEGADRTIVNNEKEYLTDYLGERAAEFVARNAKSKEPYFLYLAPTAPHDPLEVTQEYYDRFPNIQSELNRIYAAMVSSLDDMVGEVLDAVEASGEKENTLIVFLSDNGCAAYYPGMCACEPLRGGKLTHYEGGVRVPFLMSWPGVLEGGEIYRDAISSMDIFPTVLAAAGVKLTGDRVYDGVDLMPYLAGQTNGSPHDFLAWRRSPMASIRLGDWKLWKSTDGEFTLLFNLKEDLNETNNLASTHPKELKMLEDAYEKWAADMVDPLWPSRPQVEYKVCGVPFELPI